MKDFVVRIDTAKLSSKQAAAVGAAIQGAVLAELGKLDLAHAGAEDPKEAAALTGSNLAAVGVGSILFHPEWRGLWLRSLKDLQNPAQTVLTVAAR